MVPQSKRKYPSSVNKLIKRSGNLQVLKEKIDSLSTYKYQISKILNFTPEQAEHFHLASNEKQILTFHTTLAGQASQIRLMKKQILAVLNQTDTGNLSTATQTPVQAPIKDIRAFVRPNFTKKLSTQASLRKLSSQNAELLQSCSESIEDPELRSALLRLSKNFK